MFDLIAIGDVTIDTFIKLDPVASLHCDTHHRCSLAIPFGTKLGVADVQKLWGGNSGNIAVGSSRLGLKSALYSEVGDDTDGKTIFDSLQQNKVSTKYFVRDKQRKTNVHYVLDYKAERTILVHHQPRSYHFPHLDPSKWAYFSSAGKGGKKLIGPLLQYHNATNAQIAFNPGTYQLRLGLQTLKPLLRHTSVLFLNLEEAQLLLKTSIRDFRLLLKKLHYHGHHTVVITDGNNGSYCFDGQNYWYCPIYKVPVVEMTGSGDAFATGFICALIYGKPVPEALCWGSINAASVIQQVGPQAGLLHLSLLCKILNANPKFQARTFSSKEVTNNKIYTPTQYRKF